MKSISSFIIIITLSITVRGEKVETIPSSVPSSGLNLNRAYEGALRNNENIAIQKSTLERAEEKKKQAIGSVLPTLSAVGTYFKQDTSPINPVLADSEQTNGKLTLSQTIFNGGREYAAWRGANAQIRAETWGVSRSKMELYSSVAQSFYQVLLNQKDKENLKLLLDLTTERVGDLKQRVKVGRSRSGDFLSAQAQALSAQAQYDAGQVSLDQAIYQFQFVTGIRAENLVDDEAIPSDLPTMKTFLDRVELRPDIQGQKEKVQVAEENVGIARGGHLPTLDLAGNYYLKRTGTLEKVPWDVLLTLKIPLFQGGVASSQVREASDSQRETEMGLELSRRSAQKDVASFYKLVSTGFEQIKTLKNSVEISEKNYREQNRDYKYGLVTNLEVLSALNSFLDAKRTYDRTIYQTKIYWAELQAASGVIK